MWASTAAPFTALRRYAVGAKSKRAGRLTLTVLLLARDTKTAATASSTATKQAV